MTTTPSAAGGGGQETRDCTAEGMCSSLLERCVDGGKGFKALHTTYIGPETVSVEFDFLGVAYKTSAKDKGLMLNVCPFCGGAPGYFKRQSALPAVHSPELLEACKRLLGCMALANWEGDPTYGFARAAIAAATGGSQ